ncbi:MAG: ArnT family glycosyltransferase, partial [Kofleriaceae bacterium]
CRGLAWLGLLVVGSTPMFCMIARYEIPVMPMVACTIGALSLITLALEDGARPILPKWRLDEGRIVIDARTILFAIVGGFVLIQAGYYAVYFIASPQLAIRGQIPAPALWLPLMMVLGLASLTRDGWIVVRLPLILVGGIIAAIRNEPLPARQSHQSLWRSIVDNTLRPWARHSPDRYLVRAIVFLPLYAMRGSPAEAWRMTDEVADRLLRGERVTTMRQVYMLGAYFLLGVSILAKGPPGLAVVAGVTALHMVLTWRWRALYEGEYELKRGLLLMFTVAVPWHIAMYLKDGIRFIDEYVFTHILNRAAVGVDNSPGTFEYYTSQIGHGMWLWAALLPAAIGVAFMRARLDQRDGRVRFMVGLWAITAVALFCLVQTKFHHYILPAIPPLCLLVAFLLDDIVGKRERLHPLYAALGIGIVLLICRDLMYEPDRWIEMFVFRYDRPWPSAEPWAIDPSDGILALGIAASFALVLAATPLRRIAVGALAAAGLAICVWALQVYMPLAGTHWGMGDAIRTYYEQRSIYGQKLVYFGAGQLYDEWHGAPSKWTFDTFVPDALQTGQPMTIALQINKINPRDLNRAAPNRPDEELVKELEIPLVGTVTAIGAHSVEVTFAPGEIDRKLRPVLERSKDGPRGKRRPVHTVDADRLIAWQLYWRGENFWSGDEIVGPIPEMKTAFMKTDNVEFNKYLNDRTRAPLGRRYFLVTEAGRITGVKTMLPTNRARETYEVIDTTSNKFSLAAFWM